MLDFVFPCGKYEWPFGYNFQNSLFRCKKNKCSFGCSFQNFVFRCKKNKWLFGNNCKISYFAIKKQMAAWVHTLRHFKKMVTHSQNFFIGFIKTF